MTRERRPPTPLDAAALEALALRYVERFASTRGKLADYLARKVRERGWDGAAADPRGVAEKMAALGYVDDRAFATARAASLARRGYGARRVSAALYAARVTPEDAAPAMETNEDKELATALEFARRRRIGPFGAAAPDDKTRARQIAAMLRAGHRYALARRIAAAAPNEDIGSE